MSALFVATTVPLGPLPPRMTGRLPAARPPAPSPVVVAKRVEPVNRATQHPPMSPPLPTELHFSLPLTSTVRQTRAPLTKLASVPTAESLGGIFGAFATGTRLAESDGRVGGTSEKPKRLRYARLPDAPPDAPSLCI
ncbi:hypothetical protein DFH09DRAFT_1305403 [Mycena vulgaris]|nr:hypothetical protein DFH09DRAFT_1305403 [Mycena vulgaris]